MRGLFCSILFLPVKQRMDIREVLKYRLTQVPLSSTLSLANVDGSTKKAPKAKLLQGLESHVASANSASIDVMIIDAMFFLHLLVNPPSTFGSIAQYILDISVHQQVVKSIFDVAGVLDAPL